MPATITSVQVFGFNDNGKVKRVRRNSTKTPANQRFPNLKPNRLLIIGTNLNELDLRNLHLTFSGVPHTLVVIDKQLDGNTQLNVYFVVWTDASDDKRNLDLGDLTVTVETVTPTGTTGTEDDVTIED